jgi:hypothetical protein
MAQGMFHWWGLVGTLNEPSGPIKSETFLAISATDNLSKWTLLLGVSWSAKTQR